MLPNVSATDLNHPSEPGEYPFENGSVRITQHHVEVWKSEPDATFRTVLLTRAGDARMRFALGEMCAAE